MAAFISVWWRSAVAQVEEAERCFSMHQINQYIWGSEGIRLSLLFFWPVGSTSFSTCVHKNGCFVMYLVISRRAVFVVDFSLYESYSSTFSPFDARFSAPRLF
jgi:hypothetical protein